MKTFREYNSAAGCSQHQKSSAVPSPSGAMHHKASCYNGVAVIFRLKSSRNSARIQGDENSFLWCSRDNDRLPAFAGSEWQANSPGLRYVPGPPRGATPHQPRVPLLRPALGGLRCAFS